MKTRSALARDIGVGRVTLWRWERAGYIPSPQPVNSRRSCYSPAAIDAIRAFAQAEASA